MNINTMNIGDYRVTDYGRGNIPCQLFNRTNNKVYDIDRDAYNGIMENKSIETCAFVEHRMHNQEKIL